MLVACRLAGLSALEACTIWYTFEQPLRGWCEHGTPSVRLPLHGPTEAASGHLLPLAVAAAPQPQ
jgi:hypothetical protein